MTERSITAYKLSKELGISESLINKWKNKPNSDPSVNVAVKLCEFFQVNIDWLLTGEGPKYKIEPLGGLDSEEEVSDEKLKSDIAAAQAKYRQEKGILARDESLLLHNYRKMAEDEKLELLNTSARMTDPSKKMQLLLNNADVMSEFASDFHDMPLYDEPSAAGIGSPLGDEASYELIKIPAQEVPARADFLVRIRGDSMEPEFANEDLVFVCKQPTVEVGEVGIFLLDGKSLCKKLTQRRDKYYLHSLNANYEPIELHEHNDLHTFGKVLGKASL